MRALTVTSWRHSKTEVSPEALRTGNRVRGATNLVWPEATAGVDDDLFAKAIAAGRQGPETAWIPEFQE